jgi:hypothetical protein
MRKLILLLTMTLFLVIAITSCKKEEDTKTRTELITQADWIGVSNVHYLDNVETGSYNYTDTKLDFKTNFTVNFYTNNVFDVTETWEFLNGEQQLKFIDPLGDGTFDIVTLSETTLVYSMTWTTVDGERSTVLTYRH